MLLLVSSYQEENAPELVDGDIEMSHDSARIRGIASAIVVFGAVGLLIFHWMAPGISFDIASIALIVIAAIPLLGVFLVSVKLPGGIELELRQLQKTATELTKRTDQLSDSQTQEQITVDRRTREGLVASQIQDPGEPGSGSGSQYASRDLRAELTSLAAEYDSIRSRMKAGAERTATMTRLVLKMADLASYLPSFDVESALASDSAGTRLSAYAFVFAQPRTGVLEELVSTLTQREQAPFNQYWAIRALGAVAEVDASSYSKTLLDSLRAFAAALPSAAADRKYELQRILRRFDSPESVHIGDLKQRLRTVRHGLETSVATVTTEFSAARRELVEATSGSRHPASVAAKDALDVAAQRLDEFQAAIGRAAREVKTFEDYVWAAADTTSYSIRVGQETVRSAGWPTWRPASTMVPSGVPQAAAMGRAELASSWPSQVSAVGMMIG